MVEEVPIREYEQAVYVYWFGSALPTVKIGHSNDPDRRLSQLGSDTGVPDHLASFAAIVWVDRKREKVEALAHQLAGESRRSGEWFELTATEALEYILEAARQIGVRFEVEDRAGIHSQPPETFHEALKLYEELGKAVKEAKIKVRFAEKDLEDSEFEDDVGLKNRLINQVKYSKVSLEAAVLKLNRAHSIYHEKRNQYQKTPEYALEQRLNEERKRIEDIRFKERAVAYWNKKWAEDKKSE
jgi:hypothetical protein